MLTILPPFTILFFSRIGLAISNFSIQNPSELLSATYRSALWYFIIAILAFFIIATQQYTLITTAETLTGKLRALSFKAILRQDVAFFDEPNHSTGSLTGNLSDQPQKVNGLAGVTLGTIVQSIATVISGCIIGLIYSPRLAAIGIATIPLLIR